MPSAEEIWIGPTGTLRPPPTSTWIRILPWRICVSSRTLRSISLVLSLCAAKPRACASKRFRTSGATISSTCRSARFKAPSSCWTWPKSCGRKIWLIAWPRMSGKATSWRSWMALGTTRERCCFAALIAWILSSTRASRLFSSRFCPTIRSFSSQRPHSSSTCLCHSCIIRSWRLYHSSLNCLICSSSCSSSTSMRDCSRVLLTMTSRMGSTSVSKTKRSPSSTCVVTSTPVFWGRYISGGGSGRNSSVWASTLSTTTTASLATRCCVRSTAKRSGSGRGMSKSLGSLGRCLRRALGAAATAWAPSCARASRMAPCV
mmetsp:Transcript_85349/g.265301  ORF Transcript_85349/g.265301 Transcript_85349/m.265301 type:complete len:317 (+) Transcript_85349:336-1286(+)